MVDVTRFVGRGRSWFGAIVCGRLGMLFEGLIMEGSLRIGHDGAFGTVRIGHDGMVLMSWVLTYVRSGRAGRSGRVGKKDCYSSMGTTQNMFPARLWNHELVTVVNFLPELPTAQRPLSES